MIIEYILESNRYMSLIGIVAVLAVAFLFSSHRSKVSMRVVLGGLFLQFSLAFFILRTAQIWVHPNYIQHTLRKIVKFKCASLFGKLQDNIFTILSKVSGIISISFSVA